MDDQRNFVLLSCAGNAGLDFLEASLHAGVLKAGNRLFVPCLGLLTSQLDRFRYLGAEIIVLKILGANTNADLQTDLMLDLLSALGGGLMGLKLEGDEVRPSRLSCTDTVTWQQGYRLIEKIKRTKFVGETGSVILDEETGQRTNVTVAVMKMTKQGFVTDALWSSESGYLKSKGKFSLDLKINKINKKAFATRNFFPLTPKKFLTVFLYNPKICSVWVTPPVFIQILSCSSWLKIARKIIMI